MKIFSDVGVVQSKIFILFSLVQQLFLFGIRLLILVFNLAFKSLHLILQRYASNCQILDPHLEPSGLVVLILDLVLDDVSLINSLLSGLLRLNDQFVFLCYFYNRRAFEVLQNLK